MIPGTFIKGSSLKVLHCPSVAAGAPFAMAEYECLNGINSMAFCYFPHPFQYSSKYGVVIFEGRNPVRWFVRLCRFTGWILTSDIIHFNFGHSLLPSTLDYSSGNVFFRWAKRLFNFVYSPLEMLDLKILRICGKKLLMLYQGSDVRQLKYCLENHSITFADQFPSYNEVSDRLKQGRVMKVSRWIHGVYSFNPDLMPLLPAGAKFHPYPNIAIDKILPSYPGTSSRPLIVHAPSNRFAKGTQYVVDALDELRDEGVEFDFQLLEGMHHEELLNSVRRADLVIDQILAGWYGAFAVEAMATGKPVICYLRESDLQFVDKEMADEIPIINAAPAGLKDILRHWLTVSPSELMKAGQDSRRFVEKWHDPVRLAKERKATYGELLEH